MNTTLCLSTGLCCVMAGFPHLLFAQACGGAHGVISNNQTFANHFLLGFKVQGKITEADTPTVCLGVTPFQTSQRPNSIIPPFLRRMPFLLQPSQFILAWDRYRNMLDCIPRGLVSYFIIYVEIIRNSFYSALTGCVMLSGLYAVHC